MVSNEVSESDEKGEQTSPRDDGDESEVQEEDVKVCDICGDAGREDLLAVCSRCSDGAEHTYCMRDMLDKVPEGDWLCEECIYNEALKVRRQEQLKLLGTEKSKSLGRSTSISSDISSKLDSKETKDSFSERSKPRIVSLSKQLSLKRGGDNIEAGPIGKKQIIESNMGSPTVISPSQVPVLLKDCSFKNSDKKTEKPTNQISSCTDSGGDSSENARSPTRNSKRNAAKQNSFSSSKANINASEEVVQKKKLVVDVKDDGQGKFLGKSMSFKGLGRSSVGESKVKMLSPKCVPVQELKGQKGTSFERKNSIKLDNSFSVQAKPNSTKRLSRGESISTSSVNSSRDYKNGQSNGKLTNLSNQPINASLKSPDAMASLGEVKKLSSTSIKGSGANSTETKPSHISSKDGPTFNSSRSFDGSYSGFNGTKVDLHERQTEKVLENGFSRSRQGPNGASVGGNHRGLSLDTSTLRAKDGVREENKLKAAIEAAMQKKQDIVKKNKVPEKLSDLSMSNSQGNHEENAVSNQMTDIMSKEAVHVRETGLSNQASNPRKHKSIGSVKQVESVDFVSSCKEDHLTMSAIPEQEAVWQGVFEIHRNGKVHDICGGFQAHLSSFASYKALEVVRKLPHRIVFDEVSRPYVWPFQFKDASVRDDNIALYFFAKDRESYLRSYKILLEYMMKHDLALRVDVNGVELLIFPSNHLPHRSQCWNSLFFMWGVFRGRRAHCPDVRFPPRERPQSVGLTSRPSQVHIEKRTEKYSSVLIPKVHLESETTAVEDDTQLDRKVVQLQLPSQDGNNDDTVEEKSCKSLKPKNQCVDKIKKNEGDVILDINVDQNLENNDSTRKNYKVEAKGENRLKQEWYVDINAPADSVEDLPSLQCSPKRNSDVDTIKLASEATTVVTPQKRSWMDRENLSEGNDHTSISKRVKGIDNCYERMAFEGELDTQMHEVSTSSRMDNRSNKAANEKLKSLNPEGSFFLVDSHDAQIVQLEKCSPPRKLSLLGNENRLPVGSPDLELALGVEKKQSRKGVLPFIDGVIDRKDRDRPPDIASPKEDNEDASVSLSLALSFPFSDKDCSTKS